MSDSLEVRLEDLITVGGARIRTSSPPRGLVTREHLGLVASVYVDGQVVHRARTVKGGLYETRATVTPKGDYLLMFPDGGHYGGSKTKVNDMLAYRSTDRGRTWRGPTIAFDIDYNQHGFVPLIPRGSARVYAFGTQPVWDRFSCERGQQENAPIGFRSSDDDGRTWSDVTLIEPVNDPGFKGMSVMRMCETDSGAWLIGSHDGDWSRKPLRTRQYVLRSGDQGRTWTVAPAEGRPGGWYVPGYDRMDEGRPINLGGGRILLMTRTPEGHLWAAWSEDDGRTWSDPRPTPLVHPDAPPMLFHLSDATLIAFHHNRFSDLKYTGLGDKPEIMKDRSELWASTSCDGGRTWGAPRFVLANALAPSFDSAWRNYQCSYVDMFVDGGVLNLFVPHRWHQVLHLRLREDDLARLPAAEDLRRQP